MNFYDKIYNAISEGLSKSINQLQIPCDDDNVTYQHSHTKNDFNILNFYVNQLLQTKNTDIYNDIIEAYNKSKIRYICKNLQELNEIYEIIQDVPEMNLNWIDTSNLLTIVLSDGSEVPLYEYENNGYLIKFKNIENCDHPLIINKSFDSAEYQYLENNHINYAFKNKKIQIIDYNGWKNTYMNKNMQVDNSPVFKYIVNLEFITRIPPNYKAYIPAISELMFIINNRNLVDYILKYMGSSKSIKALNSLISSTEYDDDSIIVYSHGTICTWPKETKILILPFYKKEGT